MDRSVMDVISYQNRIVDLLDDACSNLSYNDFEKLKENIYEMIENYD